jgi:valyl-tRNA synthetase
MLAPILPFITSTIFRDLRHKDVHAQPFPVPDVKVLKSRRAFKTEDIVELNGKVWKAKKDKGMSLRSEMRSVTLPQKLKPLERDIKAAHKAGKIAYGKCIKVSL